MNECVSLRCNRAYIMHSLSDRCLDYNTGEPLRTNGEPFTAPPQREELMWIAVDFDGTIASSNWSPQNPTALPGPPLPGVGFKLQELEKEGYKVIVHTARPSSDYELIEAYMKHWALRYRRIVTGKLLAKAYIDDRNGPAFDAESWLPNGAKEQADAPRAATTDETASQLHAIDESGRCAACDGAPSL